MATNETKPADTAAAAKPAETAPAPKPKKGAPLFALHTINGGDDNGGASPGTVFRAATADIRKELTDLEAARELTDAEAALADKIEIRTVGGKPEDQVG